MTALLLFAQRHWKLIAIGLLIAAVGVQTLRLNASQERVKACGEARNADRQAYDAAAAKAKADNLANVRQIEKRQEEATNELRTKYSRDLERLRNGGLRDEYKAPPGSAGKPGASGVSPTTCRADAENVCVPRADLVRAGEIELSRNALIDWINKQLGVKR